VVWVEPLEETDSIHARLLGHQPAHETTVRFVECFGKAERDRIEGPLRKARECHKVGRFELAADLYRKAVHLQPSNWTLLCEVAHFLIYALRDINAGLDMVKVGLRINPTCSSELWTALANGLHQFGRYDEAEQAYLRALQLNAKDRRAKEGLAGVFAQKGDYGGALKMIAEAFVLANPGENFDELLRKQNQILVKLAQQMQMDYLLLANLISRHVSDTPKASAPGLGARQRDDSPPPSFTALESRAT
jgi:tetratricopeptide (TPR) repeat protein